MRYDIYIYMSYRIYIYIYVVRLQMVNFTIIKRQKITYADRGNILYICTTSLKNNEERGWKIL